MFVNNSSKNYGLCSSHYLSSASLSWNSIVKTTKTKLEFILDSDVCIFFEKDIRSRISYICSRYNKANNKYLKSYDSKHELKHIIYLDPNNLYDLNNLNNLNV